ncbi:MAG: FIST N-terminal domain-containing protein, partial [Dongiaceae bacterium]
MQAAVEAARQAMARAATLKADLALLLLTPDHEQAIPGAARQVREVTRAGHVLGATVAGTLTTDGEMDQEAAAVMVLGGDLSLHPGLTPASGRSREAGRDLGSRLATRSADGSLLLLLADPIGLDPFAFLEGLRGEADVPLAGGGLAGSDGGALTFLDDRTERGCVASLLIEGDFSATVDLTHACMPLTAPMRVSRAAKNTIFE